MDTKALIALISGGALAAIGGLALLLTRRGGTKPSGATGGKPAPTMAPASPEPPTAQPAVARGFLILNGRRVPTTFPVRHSRQFRVGEAQTGRRTQPLTGGVLHWTAAENPGDRVFSTLRSRNISTHFAMDPDGTVWQFADPGTTYTTNAGRSLGQKTWAIEIANRGTGPESLGGRDRPTYRASVQGRTRTIADFYPVQYENILELANLIHEELGVPKRVAVSPTSLVPWARLRNATGLVGHYHASDDKADPGPRLLTWFSRQPGWSGYSL